MKFQLENPLAFDVGDTEPYVSPLGMAEQIVLTFLLFASQGLGVPSTLQ
jgi:hypothetical protein